MSKITLLDGPMGTELQARGVDTSGPMWSAAALLTAPEAVAAVHMSYAQAGATVHTTNTFRTQRWTAGERWRDLTHTAVHIARSSVPSHHRVAGSIAPLADCYRPDLSPPDAESEHRAMAQLLADCGVDILLVETFAHIGEALGAVRASVDTGLPTWCALTAGWRADLLSVQDLANGAREAVEAGACAVLVNCVPASRTTEYVEALAQLGVPFGAYANAGAPDDGIGWVSDGQGPTTYTAIAQRWVQRGATLIGGCCGTGPTHTLHLSKNIAVNTIVIETDPSEQ
jgi:S-methylmethionine-dependent homocysteine/selenocysteine methylase